MLRVFVIHNWLRFFLIFLSGLSQAQTNTVSAHFPPLRFDPSAFTQFQVSLDGEALTVRQYHVVYVSKPVQATSYQRFGQAVIVDDPTIFQTMIMTVPEDSVKDQSSAILFKVNNAGWFASPAASTIHEGASFVSNSDNDVNGAALKAGYVIIDVGTRSRGVRSADGRWVGKAPAPVVDAKAAIRYLRLNDSIMPGSAERIVVNGTSGGGGLTAIIGASGNSSDYLPYLYKIGAAGVSKFGRQMISTISDGIFAAIAYCPINNLGNADAGYEWQFHDLRSDENTGSIGGVSYSAGPQVEASAALAAKFPDYLNSLALSIDQMNPLTDSNINSVLQDWLKKEIEWQLESGVPVPQIGEEFEISSRGRTIKIINDWLTIKNVNRTTIIEDIDIDRFLLFVSKTSNLKTVVAFDATAVTGNASVSGESSLFGNENWDYANFSEWSWNHNEVAGDGSGIDDTGMTWSEYLASTQGTALAKQIKLIDPLSYLNTGLDTARYWYVRHGMIDRDTSFAMQILLQTAISNDPKVKDINFRLPYLTGHGGNYDVQEVFSWLAKKLSDQAI